MCGIFGYLTLDKSQNSLEICIEGLKNLEYRGYDSAGIASIDEGKICVFKTQGRVKELDLLIQMQKKTVNLAVGHTRWATHGAPSSLNAHPHIDQYQNLAIVHNGIIENHLELKKNLIKKGVVFTSETDTEVVAQLISDCYQGNMLEAFSKTLSVLQGSYALALIHKDFPDTIFAAAHDTPLVIATCEKTQETFICSDPNALAKDDLKIMYLKNHEIVQVKASSIKLLDYQQNLLPLNFELLHISKNHENKGNFEHYMLKEIHEQPTTIRKALEGRLSEFFGTAHFEELTLSLTELQSVTKILIIGCGTSYHAGCAAAIMLEDIARIPTSCAIASEFRYSNPIIDKSTLVIAISQSGETADTLAAVKEVKRWGAQVIGICNVKNSLLSREAQSCLYLHAGPEISVCSTKAFTSQLTVLTLLTLYLARLKDLTIEQGHELIQQIKRIPHLVEKVLQQAPSIQTLARRYSHYQQFVFIGRRSMYIASLEAALKLKEISYVQASAYPAGELKHGPIALIDPTLPTIALCGHQATFSKLFSNITEIKARQGPLLAFYHEKNEDLETICNDVIYLPLVSDHLATIPYSVALQLFAYYIAKEKGTDIDRPRNLAKSVTVE
jgi:glucosamine--fructose-6-phosphate aminotransferase (isomerizing)